MKIRDNIIEEPADERYKGLLIIKKSAQLSNVLYELKTFFGLLLDGIGVLLAFYWRLFFFKKLHTVSFQELNNPIEWSNYCSLYGQRNW